MNNILNAQEAFAALQKGKTVLCRYAGNGSLHADKDFSTLDRMPATVFVLPNYEFCIQVEMLELAGIKFTKPLTFDEYQDGQEVFVICTYSPSIYVMNFKTNALVESINSGFVQRDAENAKLQLKALSKALGCEFNDDVTITRLGKEPSKPKRKKEPEAKITTDDASLDEIIGPVSAQSPCSDTVDPELSVLCDAFIAEIDTAASDQDLKAIRTRINSNGDLTEVESAELATRLNLKSASFEKEQSTVAFENIAAAAVSKAQEIDEETQQKNSSKSNNDEYQEKLNSLKLRVDESKTPTEVNAVIRYTNDWSEEQRAPLLQYMHKRLEELQQNKAEVAPSLMVRIQNAPDLTELDALEIDVSSLDPVIQPEMMRHVRNRRLELEKASTAAINDEDLP
ncbi:MAG: hypothetical protein [Podoviridae sp. ctbh1]|nr:MAG: hypothetical protein [Podoviridae sp. ctbh1]